MVAPSPEAMRIWMDVIVTGAEGYTQFMSWGTVCRVTGLEDDGDWASTETPARQPELLPCWGWGWGRGHAADVSRMDVRGDTRSGARIKEAWCFGANEGLVLTEVLFFFERIHKLENRLSNLPLDLWRELSRNKTVLNTFYYQHVFSILTLWFWRFLEEHSEHFLLHISSNSLHLWSRSVHVQCYHSNSFSFWYIFTFPCSLLTFRLKKSLLICKKH